MYSLFFKLCFDIFPHVAVDRATPKPYVSPSLHVGISRFGWDSDVGSNSDDVVPVFYRCNYTLAIPSEDGRFHLDPAESFRPKK